jgi:thioredoxin-related protein
MAREVYTDSKFITFSRKNVFIRLLQDTNPEGDRLARKFGVDGFPTIVVLNSSGEEVDRIIGARNTADLIEELEWIIDSAKSRKPPIRI